VLLRALVTRSTAMAKGGHPSGCLTMMEGGQWWEEAAALWKPQELPTGVLAAVKN
jgi:hypothetical protein